MAWRAGTLTLFVYRHARLHRLAESIPGLLKRLQIRALDTKFVAVHMNVDAVPVVMKLGFLFSGNKGFDWTFL